LVGLTAALAVLGWSSPGYLYLVVALDLLLFALAFGSLLLTPPATAFVARREHEPVLSVRTQNRIVLRVSYRGKVPIHVTLRDEPPQEFNVDRRVFSGELIPGREEDFSYHVMPHYRGDYSFREVFIRVPAPLGLVLRTYRLPMSSKVSVYPNMLALRRFDLLRRRGHLREIGIRRATLKGVGNEFESLREYIVGDEVRKIDWKASARRGKMIVRQYEAERSQSVILALDLGRLMLAEVDGARKFDHVVDAALMLANAAVSADDRIGLLVYHDQVVRFIPPRRGRAQIGTILEAVHGLEPEPVESNPVRAFNYLAKRWRKRSLIVAFTDLIEPEASAGVLRAFAALRRSHLCVAVTVADPRTSELVNLSPRATLDLYRRAVAIEVDDERRQAIRGLELVGVRVVDAEPDLLAQALVNQYTAIKARGEL